jgi:hypothetical protein
MKSIHVDPKALGFIASDFADGWAPEVRWFISPEQTLASAGMEISGPSFRRHMW